MRGVDKDTRRARAMELLKRVQMEPYRRPPAGPALGRPAAARGACPRADHRPAGAAARRAAVGARSVPAHQDARGAEGAADPARHHLHPCHAQPGRGDGAGRPRRGDEPGQDRAGRAAARGLQQAGLGLRRPLHRRPQRAAGRGRAGARATASSSPSAPTASTCSPAPRRSMRPRSRASRARSNISARRCRSASTWPGSETLSAVVPEARFDANPVAPGQPVVLSWTPKDVHVLGR